MPTSPVILLPPSEGKRPGADGPRWRAGTTSFPELDPGRRRVMDALVAAMAGSEADRAKLLGVKGAALASATATNLALRRSGTMAAIDRYTGVLYDALDASTEHGSLTRRERTRLDRDVVILSGLFGAVQPADPLPDYKLKMGAKLPEAGNVTALWRPLLTATLTPMVSRRVVWNLLPKEHDSAWVCPTEMTARTMSVTFLDEARRTRGQPRRFTTVNHWNKLLKGALVRHILRTGADEPDALAGFEHPEGYVYDPSLTVETDGRLVVAMVRPPA
ncbi:MAG: peroxide stress protein YaaA [Acidobacteria bacterium]|nr:peroxide stress protein YaaA [Acidobacteriota bacterium]